MRKNVHKTHKMNGMLLSAKAPAFALSGATCLAQPGAFVYGGNAEPQPRTPSAAKRQTPNAERRTLNAER